MTSTHVQTTLDYLTALRDHSGYETQYLHVTHDAFVSLDFDAAGYDVVFHNYCSRFCFDGYVSKSYSEALKKFSGLKVLAIQDEYDHTNKLRVAIKDHGFHIVLTCVPQDALDFVYPASEFPGVKFITVFTGYVPEGFAATQRPGLPIPDRPITVGYRGRDIGGRYGRLGFDKYEIGRRMKEICDAAGVTNDIGMTEESRIYGTAWFEFLGRCRSMLGSESGSNVFDFDGSVQAEYNQMTRALGRVPSYAEFLPKIADRDKQINMGQISPRVFECALMRTPMVLFRGRYSDAITPDVHYIPLELDFSNSAEVLARLENLEALETMAERTYDHLVASGKFTYKAYVGGLIRDFEALLATLQRTTPVHVSNANRILGGREAILHEMPKPHPMGMDHYKSTQLRLANLATLEAAAAARTSTLTAAAAAAAPAEKPADTAHSTTAGANAHQAAPPAPVHPKDVYGGQIADLDVLFDQLTAKVDTETSRLYGFWKWLCTKMRFGPGSDDATAVDAAKQNFDAALRNFRDMRSRYLSEHTSLVQHYDETVRTSNQLAFETANSAIVTHDQDWIGAYCAEFDTVQAARADCVKTIDAIANRSFAQNPALRGLYWTNRARIRLKDSKMEFARAALRRVPGARSTVQLAYRIGSKIR